MNSPGLGAGTTQKCTIPGGGGRCRHRCGAVPHGCAGMVTMGGQGHGDNCAGRGIGVRGQCAPSSQYSGCATQLASARGSVYSSVSFSILCFYEKTASLCTQGRRRDGLSLVEVSPCKGNGVSRRPGATLPPTAEGMPPGAQGWAACNGPRASLATGISSVPGGESPFARGIPTWPLHSVFKDSKEPYRVSASALDASHSSNAPPQMCQTLQHLPKEDSPLATPGAGSLWARAQAKGKRMAPLPRMSSQSRQQVTQPCPSPRSAGPCAVVAAGSARAGRLDHTQPKFRQTEGIGEMVSDLVALRPLWPPLGFTLNCSQSVGCCQCLVPLQQQAWSRACLLGSALLPEE